MLLFYILLLYYVYSVPVVSNSISNQVINGLDESYKFSIPSDTFTSGDGSGVEVSVRSKPDLIGYVLTNPVLEGSYLIKHALDVFVQEEVAFVAGGLSGLWIFNVSDAFNPIFISHLIDIENALSVYVNGDICLVSGGSYGYYVVDVSNKNEPSLDYVHEGRYSEVVYKSFIRSDNIAFIASYSYISAVDLNIPPPNILDEVGPNCYARDVAVSGDYMYTPDDNVDGVNIYDISQVGTSGDISFVIKLVDFQYGGDLVGIAFQNDYLFVSSSNRGLKIVNVQNKTSPFEVKHVDDFNKFYSVRVYQDYAFLTEGTGGVKIFNISNVTTPSFVQMIEPPMNMGSDGAKNVHISGNGSLLYIPCDIDGFFIYDISSIESPVLLSQIGESTLLSAENVVVDRTRDIAFLSHSDVDPGLVTFNVSDLKNPTYMSSLSTSFDINDYVLHDSLAYLVKFDLNIVDISDPYNLTLVGNLDSIGFVTSRISYHEDIVYVSHSYNGMKIIDVSDPTQPKPLSSRDLCDANSVVVHESSSFSRSVPDEKNTNSTLFAYLGCKGGLLRIIDVENSTNPIEVGNVEATIGSNSNAVDVAVGENGEYAYILNREFSGTGGIEVVDVRDKYQPIIIGTIQTTTLSSSIELRGGVGAYTSETDSIYVTDVSNKESPEHVTDLPLSSSFLKMDIRGNVIFVAEPDIGLKIFTGEIEIRQKRYFCNSVEVTLLARDGTGRTEHRFNFTRNDSIGGNGCSGHGTCNNEGRCVCEKKFYGDDCSIPECEKTCSGYGNCSKENPNHCICIEGYFGEDCNITTCYGILSNDSDERYCSGRSDKCFPEDRCHCKSTYIGLECEISHCFSVRSDNTSYVCSGKGNCTDNNNCGCESNYYGVNCNITTCSSFFSNDTLNVCSGHGICSYHDECECYENYYGESSEDNICNITSCKSIFSNDSSQSGDICNAHGVCEVFDSCTCHRNWTGSNCEITTCFNISSDEQFSVCSGHGVCNDYDECTCNDYTLYSGESCQLWTCFGVGASNHTSCNVHGVCIDRDKCFCSLGYSSSVQYGICDVWYCNGKPYNYADKKEVCSGKGTCIAYDVCSCRENFDGKFCDTWGCGNVDYKFKQTCNGHGKCTAYDECECYGGYAGKICKTNTLYGTVMAPILTLSTLVLFCGLCAICACIIFGIFVLCVFLFLLSCVVCRQAGGLRRFKRLKNFDLLMKEQEMDDNASIAHLRINRKLFEVEYEEIKTLEILGEGGSQSVVFKAIWKGQAVAFKCFKTRQLCNNQDSFNEFEKEVEILSSLSHPNIIRFFGACLNPPRVGILMEYCSKGEILDFMISFQEKYVNVYPIYQKIRLFSEVCASLEFLHSRNIIHRDLKCENVLISESENAKLMDFGLSRAVENIGGQNKTKRVGTSVYMAPEIVLSDEYDEKCDVFSFGIMLFICLTESDQPYGSKNSSDYNIELKVSNDPNFRPRIEDLDDGGLDENKEKRRCLKIPEEFRWMKKLIVKCWNHDPSERYGCLEIRKIIEENGISLDGVDDHLDIMDRSGTNVAKESLGIEQERMDRKELMRKVESLETQNLKYVEEISNLKSLVERLKNE